MEKTPPDPNLSSHEEVKNLLIESTEEKPKPSTSDESKTTTDISDNIKNESSSSNNRSSPDPCCAICLEPLQNKSFTNSCLHMFCFKCLVEWSKIKPVCPLCKQPFKSIIHNVQKDFQYDTYHIQNQSTESFWNFTHDIARTFRLNTSSTRPRFRYRTTVTTNRIVNRTPAVYTETLRMEFENHRRRFAPHSVITSIATSTSSPMPVSRVPSMVRRNIYEQNLWVKPTCEKRFRMTSPDFYRLNQACMHRLLPWLNRELLVLLHNNESQVVFVVELIMSLIQRYEITSQEFFNQIQPYISNHTRHFIHEFYHFAASPHEMDTYDARVSYEPMAVIANNGGQVRPNDVIILDNDDESSGNAATTSSNRKLKSKKDLTKNDHIKKMILKRNRETDSWVTVTSPQMLDYTITDSYSNPGPSTSGMSSNNNSLFNSSSTEQASPIEAHISDGEIEVVKVVKPRGERTPEIVDLSSDDEVTTIFNTSLSKDITEYPKSPSYSPLNPSYSPVSPSYSPVSPSYSPRYPSPPLSFEESSDIECIYESKQQGNAPFSSFSISEPLFNSHWYLNSDILDVSSQSERPKMPRIVPPLRLAIPACKTPSPICLSSSPERSSPINLSTRDQDTTNSLSGISTAIAVDKKPPESFATSSKPPLFSTLNPIDIEMSPASPPKLPTSFSELNFVNTQTQSVPAPLLSKPLSNQESASEQKEEKPLTPVQNPDIPSVPSKIVVPNSSELSQNCWRVPFSERAKRRISSLFDNKNSSETDTDTEAQLSPKKNKLKLRSVVAHFSFDNSDEKPSSSHRSSHKKHKDKKKKKKHSRKHKYNFTDSDSSS